MGRIWLGAPHDGRDPVSSTAHGARSAAHNAARDARPSYPRLIRQPAQQHSRRDGRPSAGSRPAPLRWLAWLTRR